MATNLHYLLPNFIYWIEQTTPTCQFHRNPFRVFDDTYTEPELGDGFVRRFIVDWRDSDNDIDATDHSNREALHNVMLTVFYPVVLRKAEMYEMVLQDRHDLIKVLRCKDSAVGYSEDNPTDEIGLYNRYRIGDELDKEEQRLWFITTNWQCKMREVERP